MVNTGIFTATIGSVDEVSSEATGASFTAVTEIIKVLFAVFVPSVPVYVIVGTVPLKFATGVKS